MMNNENFIWDNDRYRKDPYRLPEGYFASFPDRMMERMNQPDTLSNTEGRKLIRPWMAWASGIAALLITGWFGFRMYYWNPMQEERFQENIALLVDYYGEELHEGKLASYLEDNKIDLAKQATTDINELLQIEPDLAEQYIFESVGF